MGLAEFLLARIAEDEAFWRREPNDLVTGGLADRALAECKAKRAIVAEHKIAPARLSDYAYVVIDGKRQPAWVGGGCCRCHEGEGGSAATGAPYYCDTLCYMAEVYADHPDYRKEWKP